MLKVLCPNQKAVLPVPLVETLTLLDPMNGHMVHTGTDPQLFYSDITSKIQYYIQLKLSCFHRKGNFSLTFYDRYAQGVT